ncbi:hypothetical protein RRG08_029431 [Elysia crispata]|uniref:PDZ domain-containing protein n=1 Tax=Elysia crispata TaxID=231223 RepID=A0AAE1EEG2_9GAST|nr:hypothetical protein RRG08_029431 [Elysia crispata]
MPFHLKGSKKAIDVPRDSLDSGMGASNDSNASNSPPDSGKEGDDNYSLASQSLEPRSVLIRPVTLEELEDPDAPIVKRFLQIQRDEIGFGFVLRGSSPCYVQAVDPLGPAAKAGMKVRQFISHINGDEVIRLNHKQVSHIIAKLDILNILILMQRSGDRIS